MNVLNIVQILVVVFALGMALDYPEQRRKKRKRSCESGNHPFTPWHFEYTIGYNDKDVYRRHCKHCKTTQFTISRLHPTENAFIYKSLGDPAIKKEQ